MYRDLALTEFLQSYLSFVSGESALQGKEVEELLSSLPSLGGEYTKLIREASTGKNIT